MSLTAYKFKEEFLEKQSEDSVYKKLVNNLNYYFWSNLHVIEVNHIEYPVLVNHLYDFIEYYAYRYNGNQIDMGYNEFYKTLSTTMTEVQPFIWSVQYSQSIFTPNSKELLSIVNSIESSKECCKFLVEIRRSIADINSIKTSDTFLDILPLEADRIHLYFSAIYGPKSVGKMPLLKKISQIYSSNSKQYASDLAYVLINDFNNERKFKIKHSKMAEDLSLSKLPFSKVQNKEVSIKEKKDIEKMSMDDLYKTGKQIHTANSQKTEIGQTKKKVKQNTVTKSMLINTKMDLVNQVKYIVNAKESTEESIMNGTTVLRKILIDFNNLLNVGQGIREDFNDLYYKLKQKYPPGIFPLKDSEFKKFRMIDELSKKSLYEEMSGINDNEKFDLPKAI